MKRHERAPSRLQDVLGWSCDLLRLYQPEAVSREDALADLALACNLRFAKLRLSNRLLGDPRDSERSEQALLERDARAKRCAPEIFGSRRRMEDPLIHDQSSGLPYWSNASFDREQIERSSLNAEERRRALKLFEQGLLKVEGRRNPIRIGKTVQALLAIIDAESTHTELPPQPGVVTRWSLEFQRCVGPQFFEFMAFPKTLGILAIGMGYDLAPTRKEEALAAWLLERPDHSVEPAELFRIAYRLNDGDLYLSLLTIENLLSRAWLNPRRDELLQTHKLRPLAMALGPDADVFGSWYHFFGTLLFGYIRGEVTARVIAQIESLGSRILSGETETQEAYLNSSGAQVGAALRLELDRQFHQVRATRHRTPESSAFPPPPPSFESYIDQSEDLAPQLRKALLQSRRIPRGDSP